MWPKKINQRNAKRKFLEILGNDADPESLFEQIRCGLERSQGQSSWIEDNDYVPDPVNWLEGRRWEDELESGPTAAQFAEEIRAFHLEEKYDDIPFQEE